MYGTVDHSVIFGGVTIGEGSEIKDSVIMPGVKIGKNVRIEKTVIGANAVINDGAAIGIYDDPENKYASAMCTHGIVLIEGGAEVAENAGVARGSMIQA